jgi:N-hydroxyarylamine O-acetyltransferase
MDADAYLRRIAYEGTLVPTTPTLHALHVAHLMTVPFENLDIHLGRPIVLEEQALLAKIVTRRRGGFCYELNGLFAALLRQAGFTVHLLSAEVGRDDGSFSPPFDHLALLVETGERWLVDVGFGDSFLVPLRLDDEEVQQQQQDAYRVLRDGERRRVVMRRAAGEGERWTPHYRLSLVPHVLAAFDARCRYHQASPDSHFTQARVCSRATPRGRVTLSEARLISTVDGVRIERVLAGAEEQHRALRDEFGIVTDAR